MTEIGELTRYKVLQELGAGSFGVVFKAWDAELERPVAVKLLKRSARPNHGGELLAEARTLASLDHPAIVPIFDLGRTPGDELFIVSKYIDGQSLKNWLHSNRPSFAVAAVYVAQDRGGAGLCPHARDRASRCEAGQHSADG